MVTLVKMVKLVKWYKPVAPQKSGKMLKPTGPKIDAGGKMVKLTSAAKWPNWQNGKIGKMVESVGR